MPAALVFLNGDFWSSNFLTFAFARDANSTMSSRSVDRISAERLAEAHAKICSRSETIYPVLNLRHGKFLLVDFDVLFFKNPCLLIDLITKNGSSPTFHFNMEPTGTINSGLAVIDLSLFSLSDIEFCLARMLPQRLRDWTIEQDIYTDLASARFQPLPASYGVQPIDDAVHSSLTSCHYIGVCRHQFYRQGISRLRAERFLGTLIPCASKGQDILVRPFIRRLIGQLVRIDFVFSWILSTAKVAEFCIRQKYTPAAPPSVSIEQFISRKLPEFSVRRGPFKGLKFPRGRVTPSLAPKLIGSYEGEIAELVERLRQRNGQ